MSFRRSSIFPQHPSLRPSLLSRRSSPSRCRGGTRSWAGSRLESRRRHECVARRRGRGHNGRRLPGGVTVGLNLDDENRERKNAEESATAASIKINLFGISHLHDHQFETSVTCWTDMTNSTTHSTIRSVSSQGVRNSSINKRTMLH